MSNVAFYMGKTKMAYQFYVCFRGNTSFKVDIVIIFQKLLQFSTNHSFLNIEKPFINIHPNKCMKKSMTQHWKLSLRLSSRSCHENTIGWYEIQMDRMLHHWYKNPQHVRMGQQHLSLNSTCFWGSGQNLPRQVLMHLPAPGET